MSAMKRLPWPRSLFGRLVTVLAAVVIGSQIALLLWVVDDRLTLLARHYALTQVPALEQAQKSIEQVAVPLPDAAYAILIAPTGLKLHRGEAAPPESMPTASLFYLRALHVWRERFGAQSEIRYEPGDPPLLWVKLAGKRGTMWLGMPAQAELAGFPWRVLGGVTAVALFVIGVAYWFARRLTAPIEELRAVAKAIGRGEKPPEVSPDGPTELLELGHALTGTAAELQQIEHERALWLAGVSHDLRSPLAKLRLGVETVPQPDSPQFDTWHERMTRQIETIDRIIDQFIAYARLTSEEKTGAACSLDAVIEEVAQRWRADGKTVLVKPAATPLPALAVEKDLIMRVFDNLTDNAFKYGATCVEFVMESDEHGFSCSVLDNGHGIPTDILARVRQPFHRGDVARGGPSGAGLGLAIVERIVRMGGGTLELKNRSEGGLQVLMRWGG
ncbi:MAG: HAMP domain-containing protein [Burkholderiales bacterium]|nr:HAMP domain-containing protein [Burkholderiales bacterium]